MRVATYNILNKNVAHAKKFPAWSLRKKQIINWVKHQKVDVFATQEGVEDMIRDLQADLPEYEWIGRARSRDPLIGEYSAIFFNIFTQMD